MPCILLTRPQDKSKAFAAEIAECGWTSMIWQLLTIENRLTHPIVPGADQSLIFTSARAIHALPDPAPTGAPAICVGPATAAAARARGFSAVTDIGGDADALVQRLTAAPPRRYLHIRGVHARGDIAKRLTDAGSPTEEAIAYDALASTRPPAEIDTAFQMRKFHAIALFSPRSAAIFRQCARMDWLVPPLTAFAISDATADPVRDMGFASVIVAKRPDGAAMRAAICSARMEQSAIGLKD